MWNPFKKKRPEPEEAEDDDAVYIRTNMFGVPYPADNYPREITDKLTATSVHGGEDILHYHGKVAIGHAGLCVIHTQGGAEPAGMESYPLGEQAYVSYTYRSWALRDRYRRALMAGMPALPNYFYKMGGWHETITGKPVNSPDLWRVDKVLGVTEMEQLAGIKPITCVGEKILRSTHG